MTRPRLVGAFYIAGHNQVNFYIAAQQNSAAPGFHWFRSCCSRRILAIGEFSSEVATGSLENALDAAQRHRPHFHPKITLDQRTVAFLSW